MIVYYFIHENAQEDGLFLIIIHNIIIDYKYICYIAVIIILQ